MPRAANFPRSEFERKSFVLAEGAKALFSYIHLLVTESVGGQSHAKLFSFGGNAPYAPRRYVPGPYTP